MADLASKRPSQMSGGQQQRVAVARAIASEPALILADEPTANLDSHSSESLIAYMKKLNKEKNLTFIFASHDPIVVNQASRVVKVRDGKIL
jgi:putative ABC transport system ATP-binding protein